MLFAGCSVHSFWQKYRNLCLLNNIGVVPISVHEILQTSGAYKRALHSWPTFFNCRLTSCLWIGLFMHSGNRMVCSGKEETWFLYSFQLDLFVSCLMNLNSSKMMMNMTESSGLHNSFPRKLRGTRLWMNVLKLTFQWLLLSCTSPIGNAFLASLVPLRGTF